MRVLIVGGGAAGFFAAIACATEAPDARVTLLEAAREPLGKVLISGGGRCNVTHHCFDPALLVQAYPRGGRALRGAFSRFQPRDTVAWFAERGVALKTEADGRMFPVTDDSATIAACLQRAARRAGVEVRTGARVKTVSKPDRFAVELKSGEVLRGDRLLLATGSSPQGQRWVRQFGHTAIAPVPSLFTFAIADPRLEGLAGLSVETAQVRLLGAGKKASAQTGPLLVTHWGLSGPAVLKLSAFAARTLHEQRYRLPLQVNWLPPENPETLRARLLHWREERARRQIGSASPVELPRRLWQRFATFVGVDLETRWAEVSKKHIGAIARELTRGEFEIQGKGTFKDEFVTCGGVKLAEVDFKTMESRRVPGLHFAGEILDIDGITGGFNFQCAWTTGWLAGTAIAAAIVSEHETTSAR